MVNNSDQPIKWTFDLSMPNKALDLGILKFVHPTGTPFVVMGGTESKGIEGTIEPEKTQGVSIIFCPSMYHPDMCLSIHMMSIFLLKVVISINMV